MPLSNRALGCPVMPMNVFQSYFVFSALATPAPSVPIDLASMVEPDGRCLGDEELLALVANYRSSSAGATR